MAMFTRKALIATATAAAVAFGGTSIAGAQEQVADNGSASSSSDENSFIYELFAGSTNDEGKLDPSEFTA
ncbi:MAG: hypothetical protein SOW59_07520 [Corynebacterium sp.]|nr:hypothetical protein [Corynebacterium sp.]